ncbi:MAG: rhombosortase [Gammaproteobacteria bacterium]|jgi:rhomboid family GlyGly-CTERM serine protease
MVNPRARKDSNYKPFFKRHLLPICIAFVVTFIGLFGSDMTLWLRFDRNAILSGEVWRIFTGHLAHLSWKHLLMNVLGLALVWALFDRCLSTKRWLHTILYSALGISLMLLVIDSHLRWYVGLSGVLHGMFMVGVLYDLKSGRWDAKLLLLLIIAKLLYEQLVGPLPGSEKTVGGSVVVDAHLFGAITGIITYMVFRRVDSRSVVAHQH